LHRYAYIGLSEYGKNAIAPYAGRYGNGTSTRVLTIYINGKVNNDNVRPFNPKRNCSIDGKSDTDDAVAADFDIIVSAELEVTLNIEDDVLY
jgi:hypothetical protein